MQKSEDDRLELRKEIEDKKKDIEDQDKLIKDLGIQINELNEVMEEKLRRKQAEIQSYLKDLVYKDELAAKYKRQHDRSLKSKDFEIERLQDKVKMLEIKLDNSSPSKGSMEQSFEEEKQSKFNYAAHWVIEENLRERITDLKKELASERASLEEMTASRDSIEQQLIQVKAEWANAELERAQMGMEPRNEDY